jgi:hypothetical protein
MNDDIHRLRDENVRLRDMLRVCIAELRALDAYTIPTQAENLLTELEVIVP